MAHKDVGRPVAAVPVVQGEGRYSVWPGPICEPVLWFRLCLEMAIMGVGEGERVS